MELFLSYASAIKLGMKEGFLDYSLKTAYIMVGSNCTNSCKFCTQGRYSDNKDHANLSRIFWLKYDIDEIINALHNCSSIKRICLQIVSEKDFEIKLTTILKKLHKIDKIKISISINTISEKYLDNLMNYNIDNLTIPLDCATNKTYLSMKGNDYYQKLNTLIKLSINNKSRINTHIIYGLGDTHKEIFDLMFLLNKFKINIALFSLLPVRGTQLENKSQPSIDEYRKVQVLRYLVVNCFKFYPVFDSNGNLSELNVFDSESFDKILMNGKPFKTSGCKDCTRPYYNEKPGKQIYNFHRNLNKYEVLSSINEFKKGLTIYYLR